MMTAKGKLQRIKAADINVIGRNTQGVRIMNVDEGDSLIAVVRVPAEEVSEEEAAEAAAQTDGETAAVTEASVPAETEASGTDPAQPEAGTEGPENDSPEDNETQE